MPTKQTHPLQSAPLYPVSRRKQPQTPILYSIQGQQEPNLVNWIKQITDTLIRSKAETQVIGTRTKRAIFIFFPQPRRLSDVPVPFMIATSNPPTFCFFFGGEGVLYLLNNFSSYFSLLMLLVLKYNVSSYYEKSLCNICMVPSCFFLPITNDCYRQRTKQCFSLLLIMLKIKN